VASETSKLPKSSRLRKFSFSIFPVQSLEQHHSLR
jgi:hypothetical protein